MLGGQLALWRLSKTDLFAGLMPMYQAVQAQPHVMHAAVDRTATSFSGRATTALSAAIRLDEPIPEDPAYARNIARLMAEQDPHRSEEGMVAVTLFYGFDIGIATGGTTHIYKFAPGEF